MAKTLETILDNRLYYLADTWDWLCPEQVGFRKNQSCDDLNPCLTQSISDEYQAPKPKKTIVALRDYS